MNRVRGAGVLAAVAAAGVVIMVVPTWTAASPTARSGPIGRPHVQQPLTVTDVPAGTLGVTSEGNATINDPNTHCPGPAPDPVPDGQPIVVSIVGGPSFTVGAVPSTWWRTPPYQDSWWQLQFRGFMWVGPLAQRAYVDGQKASLASLVNQVLAFHSQNPDPGTATAATTANANVWGWDEGSALRRLGAENCLYSLTHDPRLATVMAKDVAVQYGPRYYGPPLFPVHNHGLMADLAVIRAADLLKRSDWVTRSTRRLAANAPAAWTPTGTTLEQASSYHLLNVGLWREAADTLHAHGAAGAATVYDLVARADRVSPWFTEPDRRLVVLGDSNADLGTTRSRWQTRTFRDDRAGLVVGRWSWTDPQTTYYSIRYGPRRWAHGQQERAGITWSVAGRRVLVGPGKAPYDPAGNYHAWGQSPSAHNVATADRRSLDTRASVSLTAGSVRASSHGWTTQDLLFGIRHTRQYGIARDTRTLTVKDSYAGSARFHQFWHLDPSWVLTSRSSDGKRLTFTSGGHILTVTTTGSAVVRRGSTRPVAGWNFPTITTRVPACEIQVAAAATATTTFTVR